VKLCLSHVRLQLYHEIKFLTQEPSNSNHSYHVESATLNDGDYELVPETEQRIFEDPANVVETLTEAPNQSLEIFDITDPSPAQEGKPRCITQYFKLLHLYSFILIDLYYALRL
jgi:hypothetical protein